MILPGISGALIFFILGFNNSRYFIELKYKRKLEVYGDGNSIKSISVAPFVFETFLKNEKIVN